MPQKEETIKLKRGDSTKITLKGSAAGGYEWTVTIENNELIKVDKEFMLKDEEQNVAGSSVEELYSIEAVKKGTAIVHFKQQRAWEKESPPKKEEMFIIEIS